ncbi:hypothetical protein GOODEAATRI_004819 [Goodea atripinnis]|uniref:Uncharacterized protein n=1 Tax=Goodea atripinnis TaxID=208336 RepID=A0ABV0MPV0_9TELE
MDLGGASQRSGRSAETWRGHIIQQLKDRDRTQSAMFQDLIRFCKNVRGFFGSKRERAAGWTRPPSEGCFHSSLQQQNSYLKKTTGELAYQAVELQQQIKIREWVLQEQQTRLQEEECRLAGASDAKRALKEQVEQVEEKNKTLKTKYDALLQRQREAESKLREEKEKEERMLEDMMHQKKQAAARLNHRNERRSRSFMFVSIRARQATVQKELQTAARSKVIVDRHYHSNNRACLPQEAHEQGINAVRFSFGSDLLATGGTDRVIKVWDVRAGKLDPVYVSRLSSCLFPVVVTSLMMSPGSLTHRATLDGSTEGITCVEFDPTVSAAPEPELKCQNGHAPDAHACLCLQGRRILAASHNKSALLWRPDDSVPKVTLTGHSRKVTAARFTCVPHQVVTGSTDRTVRLWDLNRTACVQQREVPSFCSDLVCSESSIISGHYDCKIRVWDSRTVNCVQELPSQGRVTSLDLSSDRRKLLSCCRDDCLQLLDLRWSNDRLCFRADGFKCGSDSTKAVIRSVFFLLQPCRFTRFELKLFRFTVL